MGYRRQLVWAYIALQFVVAFSALVIRWTSPGVCFVKFGWQMFSCPPG